MKIPAPLAAMTTPPFSTHASLTPLLPLYDAFILDQFGVLHDGRRALPGAAEAVATLSAAGKGLVILSNTSSPSDAALAKLPRMGFEREHFMGAVTSGEEAGRYVRKTYGSGGWGGKKRRSRALWLTWEVGNPNSSNPLTFLSLCGEIILASSVDDADFVLLHGCQFVRGPGADGDGGDDASIASLGTFMQDGDLAPVIDPLLRRCLDRNLPLVCANPDIVVRLSDGRLAHMPGGIARRYEEMGGHVTMFGKPHTEHFEACLRLLRMDGDDEKRSRVVHVGDSVRHDVVGAVNTGIDSIFVAGGIHRDELGLGGEGDGDGSGMEEKEGTMMPEDGALRELFKREGAGPTHVIPLFRM